MRFVPTVEEQISSAS